MEEEKDVKHVLNGEGIGCLLDGMIDEDAIAECLDNDQAFFQDIELLVKNDWKKAIIYFFGTSFEIMGGAHALVPGPQTARQIKTHYNPPTPPQFILKTSSDSYYCRADHSWLRDQIVATVKAFINKVPDEGKIRGREAMRFDSMTKYKRIFDKLGTATNVHREAIAAAIELIIRREKDSKNCSETEFDFSDKRIDKGMIANYLAKDEVVFLHDVEVFIDDHWMTATLSIKAKFFKIIVEIMVDGKALDHGQDSTTVWIETDKNEPCSDPQFTLFFCNETYRCTRSYTFRTRIVSLRDEVVVTMISFLIKSLFHRPTPVWTKPRKGWRRLNAGALVRSRNRKQWGVGGLIRDERGKWLNGFWGKNEKETDIIEATFVAIHTGLRLAFQDTNGEAIPGQDLHLEVETDEEYVAYMLESNATIPQEMPWYYLAMRCRKLLAKLGDYKITVTSSSLVGAEHKLAAMGLKLSDKRNLAMSYEAPEELHRFCSRTPSEYLAV